MIWLKVGKILMTWKDKQLEKFYVEHDKERPNWIILHTPMWNYGLSTKDFKKIQKRIGEFKA